MPYNNREGERTMKPRIRIISVGGTISSSVSKEKLYASPQYSGEELIEHIPQVKELADLQVENFSKVLSSQLTIEQLYDLGCRIRKILREDPGLTGIVVTHGTGTMEESVFMADLMVHDKRPVVFTGAMRNLSEPYTDAFFNLDNAIRTAISPQSVGKGVMVVMNGVIHPARGVTKLHTTAVDTFHSGEYGPLGYVYPDRVHFVREPLLRFHIFTEKPEFNIDLIKFVVGMDDRFIKASMHAGAKGIVIEGSGLGNVNASLVDGITHAINNGLTVVVCSRCHHGRVYPVYGTKAGAASLVERGCILGSLPGNQSRLLLMLALGVSKKKKWLQKCFDPTSNELEEEIKNGDVC